MKRLVLLWFLLFCTFFLHAEDGYRLWLRWDRIENKTLLRSYSGQITFIRLPGETPVAGTARQELQTGLSGLLGKVVGLEPGKTRKGVVGGLISDPVVAAYLSAEERDRIGEEGYLLRFDGMRILLAAKDDRGLLYGAFHLLRHLQQQLPLEQLDFLENPKMKIRVLNHWDNLDRTSERGYAGFSIWNWHELPEYIDPRYRDYARANASVGINGSVVTNVNANALVFRRDYLEKVAALAAVFRPYGIKIYLTARFSAPMDQGGLPSADPQSPKVQKWWGDKVKEIYELIPDFGGFLVKANSEGQPGPQQYGRTHVDGANMLADALKPYGGIVMWRAFVYSDKEPEDRAKQAYNEFVPLDGQFRENVLIQVKNGPVDFQPREPIHPLFGAMPKTPVMMEFQITKEYLGQGTHLVGLASMWEEVLNTDTYARGKGSTVSKVLDGSLFGYQLTGMAGVANIGTARNWTGHIFGQADWYAFARLAWNPYLESKAIFLEWTRLTFGLNPQVVGPITEMLASSYETCVRYMTPLGLHHIMAEGSHYGPGPWIDQIPRAEWNSAYYHKADEQGLGFDRTETGSKALAQYRPQLAEWYGDKTNLRFLLWFHHVEWKEELSTGRTLWAELCLQYDQGAREASALKVKWTTLQPFIDTERYEQVSMHLAIQEKEARWWRDACISYFQSVSKMDLPEGLAPPKYSLLYYKMLIFPYAPGTRPKW
ncbi:MAG: alpha-glucuronidase [Lewinellaceae bacterium]|nr:alpha-glucuronidase [Lewinellaceae bacterium]